jgi:hypothetical protein
MKGYWLILGTEITDQATQDDYTTSGSRWMTHSPLPSS